MLKFSNTSIFNIRNSIFCGSLFSGICRLTPNICLLSAQHATCNAQPIDPKPLNSWLKLPAAGYRFLTTGQELVTRGQGPVTH